jgi:hypothetical protein
MVGRGELVKLFCIVGFILQGIYALTVLLTLEGILSSSQSGLTVAMRWWIPAAIGVLEVPDVSRFTEAADTLPSPVSGRGPVGSSPVYANETFKSKRIVNLTESTQGYDRSQEDHVSVTFLDSVKKRLFGGLFLAIALCCGYSGLFCLIFYDSRNIGDYWFRAIGLNRMGSNRIGKALRIGSGTGLLIAFVLIAWHGFTLLH